MRRLRRLAILEGLRIVLPSVIVGLLLAAALGWLARGLLFGALLRSVCLLGIAARRWAHSDQVVVAHLTDGGRRERHQRLRAARRSHELDFYGIEPKDVDNGAKVTPLQPVRGLIFIQCDDIERT